MDTMQDIEMDLAHQHFMNKMTDAVSVIDEMHDPHGLREKSLSDVIGDWIEDRPISAPWQTSSTIFCDRGPGEGRS